MNEHGEPDQADQRTGPGRPADQTRRTSRPDQCTICNHERVKEINCALRQRDESGESFAKLATRFGVAKTSLIRHAQNHATDPPSSKESNRTAGPTEDVTAPATQPSAPSSQPPLQPNPPPAPEPVVAVLVAADPPPSSGTVTGSNGAEENKKTFASEPEDPAKAILLVQAASKRGQPCKVCIHEDRHAIEKALAEGVPCTRIERTFPGTSDTGIRRHRDECVGRAILAARLEVLERSNLSTADAFRSRLESLVQDAEDLVATAKKLLDHDGGEGDEDDGKGLTAENVKAVATAIKTAEGAIVGLGKLLGLFPSGTTINIMNNPHFSATVNKIVDTICDECLAPVRKVVSEVA